MPNKYPAGYRFGNWNIVCHSANQRSLYELAHSLSEDLKARRSWEDYRPLSEMLGESHVDYQNWCHLVLRRKLLGALILLVKVENNILSDPENQFAYLEPIYPE